MASRYLPAKHYPYLVKYLIHLAAPWRKPLNLKSREQALPWRDTPSPNKNIYRGSGTKKKPRDLSPGKGTCSTEGVAPNITIKGGEYGIFRDKDFELFPSRLSEESPGRATS